MRVNLSGINIGELYRVMQEWGEDAESSVVDPQTLHSLLDSMNQGLSLAFLQSEWAGRAHLEQLIECGWKTQLFFDRSTQPIGGAIFLDRVATSSSNQSISVRDIGFLYVAPEAQGKGAGRTLVDVLCHLESPDVVLADVINPFSICPQMDHESHIESDLAKRSALWREQFGQVMDPHGRLAFWRKLGFLTPVLSGSGTPPEWAPFPPIPLDCKDQPVPPKKSNHSYCYLVRPISPQGWDLFSPSATAQEWENLYKALYPSDSEINRSSLKSFQRILGNRERPLYLTDLSNEVEVSHHLLMKLSCDLRSEGCSTTLGEGEGSHHAPC